MKAISAVGNALVFLGTLIDPRKRRHRREGSASSPYVLTEALPMTLCTRRALVVAALFTIAG